MKKEKIYLCGKITDMPWGTAREKFEQAEQKFSNEYEVVNPIKVCQPDWTWEQCMKEDFGHLLTCDAIYIMDNWNVSKGARIEVAVAKALQLDFIWENFNQRNEFEYKNHTRINPIGKITR